jgi:hypothetical protein
MHGLIRFLSDWYHSRSHQSKKEEFSEPEGGCQLFEKYLPPKSEDDSDLPLSRPQQKTKPPLRYNGRS